MDESDHEPAQVSTEEQDGVVVVTQTGRLADIDDADLMQRTVEQALKAAGSSLVVFDNRKTLAPAPAVRNHMHAWVTTPGRFVAVGMVFESDLLRISANMDSLSKTLKMKAFGSIEDAVKWLGKYKT